MFDEEFDNLMNLTLADGILTDQEKQVLYNKAKEKGYNLDELEVVLQAKLYQMQHGAPPPKPPEAIVKCPACNDIIPPLTRVCPSCGHVIEKVETPAGDATNLDKLVGEIEETLAKIKALPDVSFWRAFLAKAHIIVPVYTIVLFFLVSNSIYYVYAGGIFCWISLFFIVRRLVYRKPKVTVPAGITFEALRAGFEEYSGIAATYFGENKKVKQLLGDLNSQLQVVEQKRAQRKKDMLTANISAAAALIIIFAVPAFIKFPTLDEKDALDAKEKIAKLSKTVYPLNEDSIYLQGNIGVFFNAANSGLRVTPGIDYSVYEGNNFYTLTVSPVKLTTKPGKEKALNGAINKLLKGCTSPQQKLGACADLDVYLSFENANEEEITGLGKFNVSDSALFSNFLQSGVGSISVVFSKKNLAKQDIEKLNDTKRITITIIGTKK